MATIRNLSDAKQVTTEIDLLGRSVRPSDRIPDPTR